MKTLATFAGAFALAAFAGLSPAQNVERGLTPPGTSQDGSSASEGAIQGGSTQPGDTVRDPRTAPPPQNPR